MDIQLIICVECDSKSKSDWMYVKSAIERFFTIDNAIHLKPVFMGSKSNYKKKAAECEKLRKDFERSGKSVIIYCFDTDQYEKDPVHARELKEEEEFCKASGYEFVWFCHDIEEVYLGKSVEKSAKKKMAADFYQNGDVRLLDEKVLYSEKMGKGRSNLLVVLRRLLQE